VTSTTFDAQAILGTVDTWRAPDSWQIYRANSDYFWRVVLTDLILILLLALIPVSTIVMLIVAGAQKHIAWDDGFVYFILAFGVFLLLSALYCGIDGVNQLAQIRSAEKQMLVLTPHGVVGRVGKRTNPLFSSPGIVDLSWAWDGAPDGRIFAIPYDTLKAVQLRTANANWETDIYLILWFDAPLKIQSWRIDNRFCDTDGIAQRIIEAHVRYAALKRQRTSEPIP
jgi:hypothetical protein